MKRYEFTDKEKEDIKQAVSELEANTGGELVPYFVRSSDEYPESYWKMAIIASVLCTLVIGLMSYNWMLPIRFGTFELSLIFIGAAALGFVVPLALPVTKRALIPEDRMAYKALTKAKDAFLDEQVFNTRDRDGILIFVSRLEHQVIVLGDQAINEKVEPQEWAQVVAAVVEGIKAKRIGEGFVKAIQRSQELLLDKGFKGEGGSPNELSDELRS